MVDFDLYKLAFEILIETLVSHQKQRESEENLSQLAKRLNIFFRTNDFIELLPEKIGFYKNLLLEEDESLFLNETHIPHIVKNNYLTLPYEKLAVYLIIKSWAKEFDFPSPIIFNKIGIYFKIENSTLLAINNFCELHNDIFSTDEFLSIFYNDDLEQEKLEGEWAELNRDIVESKAEFDEKIPVNLNALYLKKYNAFVVRYPKGHPSDFYLNGNHCADWFCIVKYGDVLNYSNNQLISFADLKRNLVEKKYKKKFRLSVESAELSSNIKRGIRAFNFYGLPGELIGVIGNEGVGKSSLLKIISGIQKPKKGRVKVNGYNFEDYKFQLTGFIGFVPEEDLLYYGLTARENLEIAAQLYSRGKKRIETNILVESVLNELDLNAISDVVVGKPSLKQIQPSQRRLLNIALELIRDPQVLVIDNAVSSLSLNDSSKVIDVLAKLTFKGKLIITTITQTAKESFELFDKLFVINHEGYPLYFGERHNALNILINKLPPGIQRRIKNSGEYTPEVLLGFLNYFYTSHQNLNNAEFHVDSDNIYKEYIRYSTSELIKYKQKTKIPAVTSYPPRLEKQYIIYTYRSIKAKIAEKKDLIFSLLTAPVIGIITSVFLKSSNSENYLYGLNPNIPVFLFLSILISVFNGLALTSREIIREKHLLIKEEYLHLSLFSYINAKITLFFLIIAIQSSLYTWFTSAILEIKGMMFHDFVIYLSSGVSGALLGLLFSTIHNNLNSLLVKTIPITLYLYVLLGGGWVQFKDLCFTEDKYTPVLSDLMITRWAYESLMVTHYIKNNYQKHINQHEKQISQGTYHSFHAIPKLKEWIQFLKENTDDKDSSLIIQNLLKNQLATYKLTKQIYPFEYLEELNKEPSKNILKETEEYISYLDYYFYKEYNDGFKKKNQVLDSLTNEIGKDQLEDFILRHNNIFIAQKVQNSSSRESHKIIDEELVQLSTPIYQKPLNNFGRALMFSPEKMFNNQVIKTFEFNLSIIWLFNFSFYILLITDLVNKLINKFK